LSRASLDIYVSSGCRSCRRSLELAAHIRKAYPEVAVNIIDVSREHRATNRHPVIATPTFVLNGARLSLGNPSPAALEAAIRRLVPGTRRDALA